MALLIANGADVNAKNKFGWTPLHHAAEYDHKELAELLIAKGADVNALDDFYGKPLDWTTMSPSSNDHTETADLLRKHGGKTSEELGI